MYRLNDKLKDLKPYDPVEARYRIHLDANESFLKLPREIMEEIQKELGGLAFHRYPDPSAKELCAAFSAYYGIPSENVVAGNGSDELISVLFGGFLEKGDAFATIEPDFSMYQFNGFVNEARLVSIDKRADFSLDIDSIIETCNREKIKLLIFSNPCNPTSVVCGKEDIRTLVKAVEGLVVLDEAYMDFSDQSLLPEFEEYDNLIILRTCSKAFGMAALRLGFAVGRKELIDAVKAVKSPYNVNSVSQKIGTVMLRHGKALESALNCILKSRDQLLSGIEEIAAKYPKKFTVLPCATNFAALVLEQPEKLYRYLGEQGIAVRFAGGLVRVTCGTEEENKDFLKTLKAYFAA